MNLLSYLDKENLDRRLYTYSKINSAITYRTTKNIYPLFAESYLEFDALHQRQFNTDVTFLETQPLSVYWKDEKGNYHRYSADIFTEDKDGNPIIEEVKPFEKYDTKKNRKKFEQIGEAFEAEGAKFSVITEKDIYQGHNTDNFHLLHRYLGKSIDKNTVEVIKNQASNEMPLGQYFELSSDLHISPDNIYKMLATHQLTVDFVEPIRNTIIVNKEAV